MTMFYTPEGGERITVPPEHEAILSQYRDSMPLVWEPQYCGDSFPLYPLIDEDAEPCGSPLPSWLERETGVTKFRLRRLRLGETPTDKPDFERLIRAAFDAFLRDRYELIVELQREYPEPGEDTDEAAEEYVRYWAGQIRRWLTQATREVVKDERSRAAESFTPKGSEVSA